jgi:N utilization substance protein B
LASRRKGRILAFQALYCWDAQQSLPGAKQSLASGVTVPEGLLNFAWTEKLEPELTSGESETNDFARLLVLGALENISCIDDIIQKHLKNWDIDRLDRVDLAILRISVYALVFQPEMPGAVVIDEAIDISKEFGSDDSYRFINGILDAIRITLSTAPPPSAIPTNEAAH